MSIDVLWLFLAGWSGRSLLHRAPNSTPQEQTVSLVFLVLMLTFLYLGVF